MGALRVYRECRLGVNGSPATGPELLSPSFLNIPRTPPTLLTVEGWSLDTDSSKGDLKGDAEGCAFLAINVQGTV